MKANHQFCNNCGKQGHVFQCCIQPIISSGIIACRYNRQNGWEFLIICRKNSLGYIDFLRGKYPLYNVEYIQELINEMTITEKTILLRHEFSYLWNSLWGDYVGMQYRGEEKTAKEKFNQIKKGIVLSKEEHYDLKSLIKLSTTEWSEPEWGFPKGRRNFGENDMVCAQREFEEETGISKNVICMIKNIVPYSEVFVGSNYKSYLHRYYLALIKESNINIDKFQTTEVSNMKWANLKSCIKIFRPYNYEKFEIINNINKILNKYRLIS